MPPTASLVIFEPGAAVAIMGVLGMMVGSFLNVVVHRLPIMMEREWRGECHALLGSDAGETPPRLDLMQPRSRCPQCETPIAAWDNIPVVSWLLLRGRCRHCKTPISPRYPLVEAATGAATAFAAYTFGVGDAGVTADSLVHALLAALFCWYLITLALIDADTQLLPDSLTMPLLWFGLVAALVGGGWFAASLESAVLGAVFGYLSLWSVYWLFKLVTGKEGMGYGDFKLLAALGAWLGWQALPGLIIVSSVVGAAIGLTTMAVGAMKRSEPMPFGPYLALAGIIMLFWGSAVIDFLNPGASAL